MKKEVNGGFIEYRLPTIGEVYKLIPKFTMKDHSEANMMLAFGSMIDEDLEKFVTKISIKGVKDYTDLVSKIEYFEVVSEIGKEILEAINPDKKKVSSKVSSI